MPCTYCRRPPSTTGLQLMWTCLCSHIGGRHSPVHSYFTSLDLERRALGGGGNKVPQPLCHLHPSFFFSWPLLHISSTPSKRLIRPTSLPLEPERVSDHNPRFPHCQPRRLLQLQVLGRHHLRLFAFLSTLPSTPRTLPWQSPRTLSSSAPPDRNRLRPWPRYIISLALACSLSISGVCDVPDLQTPLRHIT